MNYKQKYLKYKLKYSDLKDLQVSHLVGGRAVIPVEKKEYGRALDELLAALRSAYTELLCCQNDIFLVTGRNTDNRFLIELTTIWNENITKTLVNSMTERVATLDGIGIYYGNMLKLGKNNKYYCDKGSMGNISMFSFYKSAINHGPAFINKQLFDKYGYYDESRRIVSVSKF